MQTFDLKDLEVTRDSRGYWRIAIDKTKLVFNSVYDGGVGSSVVKIKSLQTRTFEVYDRSSNNYIGIDFVDCHGFDIEWNINKKINWYIVLK